MKKSELRERIACLEEELTFYKEQNKKLEDDISLFKEYILLGNYVMTTIKKGNKK